MTKELDVTYCFMVGNLYVENENKDGVELTAYAEDAYTITNTDLYNNSKTRLAHIDRVTNFLSRMRNTHGIDNLKIIETRRVVEIVEREVELMTIGNTLVLKPNVEDIRIDIQGHTIGTAVVDNSGVGWVKTDE